MANENQQVSQSPDSSGDSSDDERQLFNAVVNKAYLHQQTDTALEQKQRLLSIYTALPPSFIAGGGLMTLLDEMILKMERGQTHEVLTIMERDLRPISGLFYSSEDSEQYYSSPSLNLARLRDDVFDSDGRRKDSPTKRPVHESDGEDESTSSSKKIRASSLPGIPAPPPGLTARKTAGGRTARKAVSHPPVIRRPPGSTSASTRPLIVRVTPQSPVRPVDAVQMNIPSISPPLPRAVIPRANIRRPPAVVAPRPPAVVAPRPPAVVAPRPPAVVAPRPPAVVAPRPPAVVVPQPPAVVVPGAAAGAQQPLRRSTRQRYPPMKYWLGERLTYVRDRQTGVQSLVHFETYFHPAP